MKNALITGATGFLGSHVASTLSAKGWRVTGVDRNTPLAGPLKSFHQMELPSPELVTLLPAATPELIVHAAGPASVPQSVEDPEGDYRNSVEPLRCVLEALRRTELPCRVIFLSSAAVYGEPDVQPVSENATPAPISPYGVHKLMCEELIAEYHRTYGVRGCSVRIFSAYGPGLRRQVLWDVANKIMRQPVVELLGTGEETRDFIHAADVARGVEAVCRNGAFGAEVYNLATGRETTIRELAELLVRALRPETKVNFSGQRRACDPVRWWADIGRISELGYAPRESIAEGVAAYANWFQTCGAPMQQVG